MKRLNVLNFRQWWTAFFVGFFFFISVLHLRAFAQDMTPAPVTPSDRDFVPTSPTTPASESPPESSDPSAPPAPTLAISQKVETQERQDQLNLTGHRPMFIIYGHNSTKLQFSFKYQLVRAWPIYFGYTQLMFWELENDSRPLRNINFNPEFFYRFDFKDKILQSIDLSPYEHLSNGREGIDSRSLNRAYAQINLATRLGAKTIRLSTRFSQTYDVEATNSNFVEYVGPVDFRLTITQVAPWILDRGEIYVRAFPGGYRADQWGRGAQEVGLSFRIGKLDETPSIFLQFYHGYAESLIQYSRSEERFRIGLLL